jgi:NOL1/NOP2/fmu family ribosome biogenesis protein
MSREEIERALKKQFGVDRVDLKFKEMGKGRIYAYKCDGDLKLKIVSQGIYFGTLERDGLRLSIEGSFIVGRVAKKNVIEISREDAEKWMRGESIETDFSGKGYVILKYRSYFLGCGKLVGKRIINFVPKKRRIYGR